MKTTGVYSDIKRHIDELLGDDSRFIFNEDFKIEYDYNFSIKDFSYYTNMFSIENDRIKPNKKNRDYFEELLKKLDSKYPGSSTEFLETIKYLSINNIEVNFDDIVNSFSFTKLNSILFIINFLSNNNSSKKDVLELVSSIIINTRESNSVEFYTLHSILQSFVNKGNKKDYLPKMLDALLNCFSLGNSYAALDNLRKLSFLLINSDLKIRESRDGTYFSPYDNVIYIDRNDTAPEVLLHEFGHAWDQFNGKSGRTKKFSGLLSKTRENIEQDDGKFLKYITKCNNYVRQVANITRDTFDRTLVDKYGSVEEGIRAYGERAQDILSKRGVNHLLKKFRISDDDDREEVLNYINSYRYNPYELGRIIYEIDRRNFANRYLNRLKEGAVLDIISAIYGREVITINGQEIALASYHTKEYYEDEDLRMCEIIAEINSLIVTGDYDTLAIVKELIGEEVFEEILREYYGEDYGKITFVKKEVPLERKVSYSTKARAQLEEIRSSEGVDVLLNSIEDAISFIENNEFLNEDFESSVRIDEEHSIIFKQENGHISILDILSNVPESYLSQINKVNSIIASRQFALGRDPGFGRGEVVLDSLPFKEAFAQITALSSDSGAFINGSVPFIGTLRPSYGYGKIIGSQSIDGSVRYRLDYDPIKGVHFNYEDSTKKICIPITDLSYEGYMYKIDQYTTKILDMDTILRLSRTPVKDPYGSPDYNMYKKKVDEYIATYNVSNYNDPILAAFDRNEHMRNWKNMKYSTIYSLNLSKISDSIDPNLSDNLNPSYTL